MKRNTNRRMIVADVENVNGGPIASPAQGAWVERILTHRLGLQAGDQVVIGCNRDGLSLTNLYSAWGTRVRYVAEPGTDGADCALLQVMTEDLPQRFDELLLVSGDHIFAPMIAHLATNGLPTHVFAHTESLAPALKLAATRVSTLRPQEPHEPGSIEWKEGA